MANKYMNALMFLVLGGSFFACRFDKKENKTTSAIQYQSLVKRVSVDSIHSYERKINCGSDTLKVITNYISDSVDIEGKKIFKPIITKQKLSFLNKEEVLSRLNYPVDSISYTTFKGKRVTILENTIEDIGVIKGKRGTIFAVSGGGQNSSTEFYGLYTVDGTLLAYSYANTDKIYGKYGSLSEVQRKYGIADSVLLGFKYNTVAVNPPFDTAYYRR